MSVTSIPSERNELVKERKDRGLKQLPDVEVEVEWLNIYNSGNAWI
jgi:hypothetical protein